MIRFSRLYEDLSRTSSINEKVNLLAEYFAEIYERDPASGAWAAYFLSGKRLKRVVSPKNLREWVSEKTGVAYWLLEDSYSIVGDLAETLALLLVSHSKIRKSEDENLQVNSLTLQQFVENHLLIIRGSSRDEQKRQLLAIWQLFLSKPDEGLVDNGLSARLLFIFHKLLTGGFRIGVSRRLLQKALAKAFAQEESFIAQSLMGDWLPSGEFLKQLKNSDGVLPVNPARPYPFCLAHPVTHPISNLGFEQQWLVEWKWDGIRIQIIKRDNQVFLWTRGEEIVNQQFPEIVEFAGYLSNGTVLDGEVLVWDFETKLPRPFHHLQVRLGRQKPSKKMTEQYPVVVLLYDVMEHNNLDVRTSFLAHRKVLLNQVIDNLPVKIQNHLQTSPVISFASWDQLSNIWQTASQMRAEGLMIKASDSHYLDGRKKGTWWKWKADPYYLDVVLIYAQTGHGRRANMYTDYTLAIWDGPDLVPIAKAYSGLSDKEIAEVDRWIKKNTLERYGPVRKVEANLVFEIAFEGIAPSSRHKSGLAVRFPRISRWRKDKKIEDADSIETARLLMSGK